jgi:hypothetical protein
MIKERLLLTLNIDEPVKLEEKKLEVKICEYGKGVFALEPIKEGTVFLKCDDPYNINSGSIERYINDLNYNGDIDEYKTDENIKQNTNVGYIRRMDMNDPRVFLFGEFHGDLYLYAIKDIDIGEELSRFYGSKYWLEAEKNGEILVCDATT